jgi:hypothetical protein
MNFGDLCVNQDLVTKGHPIPQTRLFHGVLTRHLLAAEIGLLRQDNHLADHAEVVVKRAEVVVCSRSREVDPKSRWWK